MMRKKPHRRQRITASQAPATKQDVGLLMEEMGKLYQEIGNLREENKEWKAEIIHEFHVVAEQMKSDFQGAFADRLQQHHEWILDLRRRAGIVA